ncbi:MAG TPA: hypothetical protein VIC29_06265 [Steroidobacteraceae bacterium]
MPPPGAATVLAPSGLRCDRSVLAATLCDPSAAAAVAGAPLEGALAAARGRRLLLLRGLLLLSTPPCPRHAPLPLRAEAVPSLHSTPLELLAVAELDV